MRLLRRVVLAALLMLPGLVLVPGHPALAESAIAWHKQLAATASHVSVGPSGHLATGCNADGSSNAFQAFDASGEVTNVAATLPDGQDCQSRQLVGPDGTIYSVRRAHVGGEHFRTELIAWRGNSQVASATLDGGCANDWPIVLDWDFGADGNIYAIIGPDRPHSCVKHYQLVGFDPSYLKQLAAPTILPSAFDAYNASSLAPYKGGLAIWQTSANAVRYFGYGGQLLGAYPYSLQTDELATRFAVSADGRAFVLLAKNQSSTEDCANTQVASRLLAFDPSGSAWQYAFEPCATLGTVQALPSGGAAMIVSQYSPVQGTSASVLALQPSGAERWRHPLPKQELGNRSFDIAADTAGHIIVASQYSYGDTGTWYPALRVSLLNEADHAEIGSYSTEATEPEEPRTQLANLAFTDNRLYAALQQCGGSGSQCTSETPQWLYAIDLLGIGREYPEGAVRPSVVVRKRNYVALGDSFSSGEGALKKGEKFDAGTDVPSGKNRNLCHRSKHAYPRLLAADTKANVSLRAFVACSGATTEQILGRWPAKPASEAKNLNEPPQVNALTKETDLVTITIGGNDVGFEKVVTLCVVKLCEFAIDNAWDHVTPTDLGIKLMLAFRGIKKRIGPQAAVLVIGYPQLVPVKSNIDKSCKWGPPMTKIPNQQLIELRRLGDGVNAMIQKETERAGFTFVPNNSFQGHELCTKDPYVNRVYLADPMKAYSVHPNLKGVEAIKQLLLKELQR